MRPIDADVLYDKAETWYKGAPTPFRKIYRSFVDAVADAPTITPPPNDPLTLEQLREMDGEPVYLDFGDGGEWGLVRVQQGKVFITHKNTICAPANILLECGGKAYRCKPERSVQTVPLHAPPWAEHFRARFERTE